MPLDRSDIIQLSIFLMTRPSELGRAAAAHSPVRPRAVSLAPSGQLTSKNPL